MQERPQLQATPPVPPKQQLVVPASPIWRPPALPPAPQRRPPSKPEPGGQTAHEGAFQRLLDELAAEHERVCSQNAVLQAEVTHLLSRYGRHPPKGVTSSPGACAGDRVAGSRVKVSHSHAQASSPHEQRLCACLGNVDIPSELKEDGEEVEVEVPPSLPGAHSPKEEVWEMVASALLPALPGGPGDGRPSRSRTPIQATELHATWDESSGSNQHSQGLLGSSYRISRSHSHCRKALSNRDCIRGGDTMTERNILQRFVVGPNSRRRVVWDMLSLFILSFDILTVPMVAFDLPESIILKLMDLLCTAFWTLDMPMSLLTGFHDAGVLEMRPSKIARAYFRSWFAFDSLVIFVDWLMILTESAMAEVVGLFRISKVVRMVRIFRLFRLLRLLKVPALLDEVGDYIQSEHLFTAFGVMRSLTIIAIVNHFIACGWYAVGQMGEPGWVERLDEEDRTISYRYATALHWSLTQFTPSSMEIHPRNLLERVFSICVLFTALVVFSSFVSSITNAMTQLHQANRQKSKQREDIRKYISDNKLSLELGNRIVAFVRKHRASSRKRVHEDEIQILKVLPESLRVQLHWEVYLTVLTPHPFFFNCHEVDEGCLLDICHNAMGEMSLGSSQDLFTANQTASKMYFLISGVLEYFHELNDQEMAEVPKGHWCVEVVLWIRWVHEGRLAAVPHCELVTLDGATFRKYLSHDPSMHHAGQEYARQLKKLIDGGLIRAPLDIWMDFDTVTELAQRSFRCTRQEEEPENQGERSSPAPVKKWRPWRTVSLIRKVPPPMKFAKSNSMP